MIIAQGKAAEVAALGKEPNQPTSFVPSGFARPWCAKPCKCQSSLMTPRQDLLSLRTRFLQVSVLTICTSSPGVFILFQ